MNAKVWHILFSGVAACLLAGCVALPASKLALRPPPNLDVAAEVPDHDAESTEQRDANDIPVQLDVRDLAGVLDTMSRLEHARPEWRGQMLAELSQTDAANLPAVVKKWHERAVAAEATVAAQPIFGTAATPVVPAPATEPSDAAAPEPAAVTKAPPAAPARETLPMRDAAATEIPDQPPTWDELMQAVVARTRERADGSQPDAALARLHAALLELIWHSGAAAESGAAVDPELWRQLAPAVELSLGNHASPHAPQEIIESLQVATELLRGPGRFQVRGLAFCRRIRGYDNIERLETSTFSPSMPVLLYSEVDHFVSDPVNGGFHTKLSSSLELLGPSGQPVWRQLFAAVEDQSDAPRRDFFMSHSFRLPADLAPGRYNLRLTLHDELANRTTTSGIALSIR